MNTFLGCDNLIDTLNRDCTAHPVVEINDIGEHVRPDWLL